MRSGEFGSIVATDAPGSWSLDEKGLPNGKGRKRKMPGSGNHGEVFRKKGRARKIYFAHEGPMAGQG